MDKNQSNLINRHNLVGGQAVIEGVMMKKDNRVSLAVRKEDGTIEIKNTEFNTVRKKFGLFNKPIIRGIIAFVESLILSFKTLGNSTAMLDLDGDKKDKNGKKKSSATNILVMVISLVLGLGLSLVLFSILPTFVAEKIVQLFELNVEGKALHFIIRALIEGVLKVAIFVAYLFVVSLMKDIRRTFEYHGAEHKVIACFESGHELTIENVRKCTRLHPRCGTSFMFITILLSVFVSVFVPFTGFLRVVVKLLLLPLVMGISYEYILYAGKNENFITKVLSAPGLWMQRITTKEPSDDQIAVAICAVKAAIPELYYKVGEEEFTITRVQNRNHIANTDKKYPAEEPIYKVPENKVELFQKNAEAESSDVEITVNGKPSKINVTKYTKQ